MKILSEAVPAASLVPGAGGVCLAVGVFDGVHLGHLEVIRQTLSDARARGVAAVAVTFDRHPNAVVAPERTPPALCPLWRRLAALEATGLDATLVCRFDEAFSRQPAEVFIEALQVGFGAIASISVGVGFVFGHRRGGDLALLSRLGNRDGFAVRGVRPLEMGGEVVSSTRLRDLVAGGHLDRAAALLGRRHTIAGEVVAGDRLGRQLGYPTANVDVRGLVLPPEGVYAGHANWEGRRQAAAVNVGRRPTVDGSPAGIRVEAHLPGFQGELYGVRMELDLVRRLRGEVRFSSRDALVDQIRRDVAEVEAWNRGLP